MSQAALALYLRIVTARSIPIMMRRLGVLDSRKPRSFYALPVPFASPSQYVCQQFRTLIRDRTVANCLVALPLIPLI
jgi:hypothetical protein